MADLVSKEGKCPRHWAGGQRCDAHYPHLHIRTRALPGACEAQCEPANTPPPKWLCCIPVYAPFCSFDDFRKLGKRFLRPSEGAKQPFAAGRSGVGFFQRVWALLSGGNCGDTMMSLQLLLGWGAVNWGFGPGQANPQDRLCLPHFLLPLVSSQLFEIAAKAKLASGAAGQDSTKRLCRVMSITEL